LTVRAARWGLGAVLSSIEWENLAEPVPISGANIRRLVGQGLRIAFISGNFNVVHAGHLRLFKFAAEMCDYLVVGLNPDTAPGVSVPLAVREEALRALSMVDIVVPLTKPPASFIAELQPDFVVKGKEFETRDNPEKDAVEAYGGKLVFGSGEMRFSSLDLLHREYFEADYSSIRKPLDYPRRHGFDFAKLKRTLAKFAGLRLLVIGDLIVDDYVSCDPLGMSQEDPTIVVTPVETKTFIGGAGIVAAHAKGLDAEVRFYTVAGDDEAAGFARSCLAEQGVDFSLFVDDTRPTTRKVRYRALGKTLLRVNHLRQHPVNPDIARKMLAAIEAQLPSTDVLLFSDFNYGCLPQALVDAIAERAAKRGIMMAADSQASSQYADISRFKGMTLITPTEREARLALRDFELGIAAVGERLREVAHAKNVVITLGSEGLLVFGMKDGEPRTDRLPALNTAPKDVAGAGDSLFTCTSLALCTGADIWESTYLGSLAAACQVSRVGNTPLSAADILNEVDMPQ
jgi:rfaE bifunctional protein kinase chain/domain